MPEEVAPGIFRLAVSLSDSPLGSVNAYAVTAPDGLRLVDCGWDTPEAYAALTRELGAIGAGVGALREILVTHIHPDHFGLAARLAAESGARVSMHRLEAAYVGARYQDTRSLVEEMNAWLGAHGAPPSDLAAMTEGSLEMLRRVGTCRPDAILEGGEVLAWGEYELEVLWTPGHSAGLICLYAREAQLLFSSDHVLQRISPHVGLHAQSFGNPLGDYLQSLRAVRDLPVLRVLPGHGGPFSDLPGRVAQLTGHHRERLEAMAEVLRASDGLTAYDVAGQLSWRGAEDGWQHLEPFQRRMALTETVAHLEYLYGAGQLSKQVQRGRVLYRTG